MKQPILCALVVLTQATSALAEKPNEVVSYTKEQAQKGADAYSVNCASCHGAALDGGPFAGPLNGTIFADKFRGKTANQLFNYIHDKMPPQNPGILSKDIYAEIVAYLLRENGVKPGKKSLSSDVKVLESQLIPSGNTTSAPSKPLSTSPAPSKGDAGAQISAPVQRTNLEPSKSGRTDFRTWEQYLGGADSSQYSSLTQINKSNVAKLKIVWSYENEQGGFTFLSPTIVRNVLYGLGPKGSVVALNAKTGSFIWEHKNEYGVQSRGINQWVSADGKDRRLFFVSKNLLKAVDAATGKSIPHFGNSGEVDLRTGMDGDTSKVVLQGLSNPGRVFENLIIISLPASGAGYLSRPADIHAYDVRTGALRWVFHTIPKADEYGAQTWPKGARESLGGVHNWSETTVDEKRGIVYIPTGTARYDFYGANRQGENLFANSLLALDARTGKRIWHFQMVHHDLWDYDLPQAPKLITVTHDGKKTDAVVQATKMGFVFAFDRETGKPLWPIEERQVPKSDAPGEKTWPTQPFPTKPPPFDRQSISQSDVNPYLSPEDKIKAQAVFKASKYGEIYTPPSLQGTISMPGHQGGTNWGGSAIDPLSGEMFVLSRSMPTMLKLKSNFKSENTTYQPDSTDTLPPNVDSHFVPYIAPVEFILLTNRLPIVKPPWSQLTAYDLNKGVIKWQVPVGGVTYLEEMGVTGTGGLSPRGGPVVTASGLIFLCTTSDRKLHAYEQSSGKLLWEYALDAACEGVPSVFEVEDQQYIAVSVGGNGIFGTSNASKPGPGRYIVFALPR